MVFRRVVESIKIVSVAFRVGGRFPDDRDGIQLRAVGKWRYSMQYIDFPRSRALAHSPLAVYESYAADRVSELHSPTQDDKIPDENRVGLIDGVDKKNKRANLLRLDCRRRLSLDFNIRYRFKFLQSLRHS